MFEERQTQGTGILSSWCYFHPCQLVPPTSNENDVKERKKRSSLSSLPSRPSSLLSKAEVEGAGRILRIQEVR